MRVKLVGHASLLIEAGGVTILSDPWWSGPCFGAQWWNYPPPQPEALNTQRIDYIYISHGHDDHFHSKTLRTLDKKAKVLVSREVNLASDVEKLGFSAIELDQDQVFTLAPGITCRIMKTYSLDTLMVIDDGHEVCVNLNDALHAAPRDVQMVFVARLKELYPSIDYVFCGYAVASYFPNCLEIPGKHRARTAIRRQQYFNRQWAWLISALNPRYGFPFAADVVLFEKDLFWANEPIHNGERPTEAFRALNPESTVKTLDIAPGFVIQEGVVVNKTLRQPLSARELERSCKDEISRANRYGTVDETAVQEIITLIQAHIDEAGDFFTTFRDNYRFLILFRNSPLGIRIEKQGARVRVAAVQNEGPDVRPYDITYTTRLPYLRQCLTMPFGHEILFVGSGGVFHYRDQATAKRNLHRELMHLIRKRERTLPLRRFRSRGPIYQARQAMRWLMGRSQQDLYDLALWTEFESEAGLLATDVRRP